MSKTVMKSPYYFINCLINSTVLSMGIASIASAHGLPLQVGVYRTGSNYIQIAEGERLCYQGFSARGSIVASIAADPQHEGFYQVNGLNDIVLYQPNIETLFAGSVHQLNSYTADYSFSREISSTLQQCLTSTAPFFVQE